MTQSVTFHRAILIALHPSMANPKTNRYIKLLLKQKNSFKIEKKSSLVTQLFIKLQKLLRGNTISCKVGFIHRETKTSIGENQIWKNCELLVQYSNTSHQFRSTIVLLYIQIYLDSKLVQIPNHIK